MPSKFDELLNTHLHPYIDEHYGQPFTLTPVKRSPNGRAEANPDRPVIEAIGVFDEEPFEPGIQLGDRKISRDVNELRALRNAHELTLSIQLSCFPWPAARPRQGDVVELEAGRFEVVGARPDGAGRIELQLVRAPRSLEG